MHPPILELRNIQKSYPGVQALKGVDLRIPAGGAHALIGENGAGKSTLLKILSATEAPDSGQIVVDGVDVHLSGPRSARAAGIAMVHQELQLVPNMDIAQNLFLGAVPVKGIVFSDRQKMYARAAEALHLLDVKVHPKTRVQDLSVAEKQLVEIARACLWNARIIAMDEPTSALTVKEFEVLAGLIIRLRRAGTAIIYVSHKLDELFRVCDTGTVLRDGSVVQQIAMQEQSQKSIISLMVGRELKATKRETRDFGRVTLEASNLYWRDRVRGVSLTVKQGEVLGIAGLVGAGRTELIRLLAGIEKPDSGEIFLDGIVTRLKSPSHANSKGIGLVPEDRKKEAIIPARSILSNAGLPVLREFSTFGFVKKRELNSKIVNTLRQLGLRPMMPHSAIKNFSGGNQQKAILARWIVADCSILLFDEPTRGIDVGAKQEIYDLIDTLAKRGKSVIVVSSELPEIIRVSDRVAVIREGELAGLLTGDAITEHNIVQLAVPEGIGRNTR